MSNESTYQFTELQEKWLKALESGDYSQCKDKLHDGGGYCCLGVACVVAGIVPVLVGETVDDEGYVDEEARYVFDGEGEAAPDSLVERLMLRSPVGTLQEGATIRIGEHAFDRLVYANDNGGTFAEIAAFIRANPEKVFLP